jgi:hypothetical protein
MADAFFVKRSAALFDVRRRVENAVEIIRQASRARQTACRYFRRSPKQSAAAAPAAVDAFPQCRGRLPHGIRRFS